MLVIGNSMVLGKSNDVYEFVVWVELKLWNDLMDIEIVNLVQIVMVNFGFLYYLVKVYDILIGIMVIVIYIDVSMIMIFVSDYLLIIEIDVFLFYFNFGDLWMIVVGMVVEIVL